MGSTLRIAGKMRNRLTEAQLQSLKSNYLKARNQFYQVGFHVSPFTGRRKWRCSPSSTAASFSAVISPFSRRNSRISFRNIRRFSGIP